MRRFVLIPVVMAAIVVGADVSALRAAGQLLPLPLPITLSGTLVDIACYTASKGTKTGADHAKCAMFCAQKGGRVALVTGTTGDVYMVIGVVTQNNNAKLVPLMNRPIVVTGTVGVRPPPLAPIVAIKTDGRRPTGNEEGVVANIPVRLGDFREGDVPNANEMTIEITNIKLQ